MKNTLTVNLETTGSAGEVIPTRYLHTPAEMCEVTDIEAIIQLVAAFARRLGRDTSFVR